MSEKTPNTNNGFDETDPRGEEFSFPGTERDDLTEEEKEFTFDEDYLEDGTVICPNCGAKLEFDAEDLDTDEEDD